MEMVYWEIMSDTQEGRLGFRGEAVRIVRETSPPLLRRTLTGKLESLLPNVERVEIPNASHMMHEQNPIGFNQAVLAFLYRHTA